MVRRFVLFSLSGLVCSTALLSESRAKSSSEATTEVEVAAYQGQSSGAWLCGPPASARYGGLAAQVRHSERSATKDQGIGTTIVAGAALEGQRIVTEEDAETETPRSVDSDLLGAGFVRVGYHAQYVGIEAGAALLSALNRGGGPSYSVFPNAELSLGRRDLFHFLAGVGPSHLTNQLSVGIPYLGFGLPLGEASLNARLSFDARVGPLQSVPRLDLFWTVPFNQTWSLRGGLAIGEGDLHPAHQASLGFAFKQ